LAGVAPPDICYPDPVVASSIRIQVGLQSYQIESYYGDDGGGLPINEARALLRLVDDDAHDSRRLLAFARALCRSTLEWDDDPHVLDDLLRRGRLRVRPVQALVSRDQIEAPPPEYAPVANEIVETHTVEIDLVDADGNPVPGEPYRIKLPDGTIKTGKLDDQGKARITGIAQGGTCQVCFYKRDAAVWAPA
jgi:hypothetical protein